MSKGDSSIAYMRALEDFRKARKKAELHHLWSVITGKSESLLAFNEISKKVHTTGSSSKGWQDIPVESIVGSVNRYQDFDQQFLPLHDEDDHRWARVKAAMTAPDSVGLPPIQVYKVGEAYFVMDGNHRVSIARQSGIKTIEAEVIEVRSKVKLSPEDSAEDIILKAEYADFLEETQFNEIIPGVDLTLTFPGLYETLKEHILTHRYFISQEQNREIPWEEAVRHWYEYVYLPVVGTISDQDILKEFPDLTATDLYIWVLDHQTYMKDKYGWFIQPEKAATSLVRAHGKRLRTVAQRFGQKIAAFLLPKPLENFGTPGEWHLNKRIDQDSLFSDILVAMDGSDGSWTAFEQAVSVAMLENGDLHGLVINGQGLGIDQDDLAGLFQERLNQANLDGGITFTEGRIAEIICEHALVSDLVIVKLLHPPPSNIRQRLQSGLRLILRQSTRPVLLVQNRISPLNRLLLAYDGSPKGKEALFVASYLIERHRKQLTVLVVDENEERGRELLAEVEDSIGDKRVKRVFRKTEGSTSDVILQVALEESAECILIGGYGFSPLLEVLLGSTVDGVLRGTNIPILVCQ